MHAKGFEVFRGCAGDVQTHENVSIVYWIGVWGGWLVGTCAGVLYSVCQGRFAVLDCMAADDRLK